MTRGVGVLSQERTARLCENSLQGGEGPRLVWVGLGSLTHGRGGGSGIDSGRPYVCSTSSRRKEKMKKKKRNKIVFLVIIFICIDMRVC